MRVLRSVLHRLWARPRVDIEDLERMRDESKAETALLKDAMRRAGIYLPEQPEDD